jgi:hypothetical protein
VLKKKKTKRGESKEPDIYKRKQDTKAEIPLEKKRGTTIPPPPLFYG